jgi:hypothetical protein
MLSYKKWQTVNRIDTLHIEEIMEIDLHDK